MWTLQEAIAEIKPALVIECGTYNPEFEIDQGKVGRFLITHHPKGWLKRIAG